MVTEPSFAEVFVLNFFLFAIAGWFMESVQESIVRKKMVSKGFFYGPWVPVQGLGGLAVYFAASPLRAWPPLVFLAGSLICTAAEYLTAVFLEKVFSVKCWDYATYPHTKWCHFQGRICLTISVFFGFISLAVLYFFWDFGAQLLRIMGSPVRTAVIAALLAFLAGDVAASCVRVVKAVKSGKPLSGWAVFSPAPGEQGAGGIAGNPPGN